MHSFTKSASGRLDPAGRGPVSQPHGRRAFLGALLASTAAAAPRYAPAVLGQVYVWTQYFRAKKISLADGIGEMFQGVRAAGFRQMELMTAMLAPELRERTLAAVKSHGVGIPVVYHGGVMHQEDAAARTIAEALDAARVARGAGTVYLNFNPQPKPAKAAKTDAELQVQASMVRRLEKELGGLGMKLMLHHHDPEMHNEAREWRHLLRNTETRLCLDTHWIWRGGQDVMQILKESGSRLQSLHLRNSRDGVWTEELGDGDVDYRQVAAHIRKTGFTGYLTVELATEKGTPSTRPLPESLRISREYVEQVFGVKA